MIDGKKIAKNTVLLFISEILSKILTVVYIIFMTRHLGAGGFGTISYAMAFTGIFAIFIDFGISQLSVRDISRDKSIIKQYLNNIVPLKVALSALCLLCIIAISSIFNHTQETQNIIYIFTLQIITTSFNQTFYSMFQSYEEMEYMGIGKMIYSIGTFIGIFCAIFLNLDIMLFAFVFLISSIINMFFCIGIILKRYFIPKMEFNLSFWKQILKDTIPFGLSGVFVTIYFNVDSIMIYLINGSEYVGWYNAAYRLVLALLIMPAMVATSILPALSKSVNNVNNSKIIYLSALKLLLAIALLLFTGVMSFSNEIITLVFGIEFVPSINALRVLILLIPIIFVTYLSGNLLVASNKQKYLCNIVMLNAILNILLNLYLIPRYNIIGASIATVLTEVLGLILMIHCISKNFFKLPFSLIMNPLLSGMFMFLSIYLLKEHVNWVVLGIFSSMIYMGILFLIDRQMRSLIYKIIKNIKDKKIDYLR